MRTLRGVSGNYTCSISKDDAGRITVVKEDPDTMFGAKCIIRTTLTVSPSGNSTLDKIAESNGRAFSPVHKQTVNPSLYELFSTLEEGLNQRNDMCSLNGILEEKSTKELMLAITKLRFSGKKLWQEPTSAIAR